MPAAGAAAKIRRVGKHLQKGEAMANGFQLCSWWRAAALAGALGAAAAGPAQAAGGVVFFSDFEAGAMPAQIDPGSAALTGVQDFAGLGPSGNQFGGSFLRSETANVVTLTLTGLAPHDSLSIGLLFAAIDSLDGTGTFPSGDYFHVRVDGVTIFRESFANALESQIQSYVPPPGVELARHVDLGFGGPGSFYRDSAYNLGADPAFQNIAHSASTAVITFQIEGVGNQNLSDESWAMDRLSISVSAVPEPAQFGLWAAGLTLLLGAVRRRRRG